MKIHPLWYVCLLIRIFIVIGLWLIITKINNNSKWKYIIPSIILLVMGLGFIIKGVIGSNNEFQISKVFWHETRYVHGIIYVLSALYLVNKNINMCLLLLSFDIIFSILYRIVFNK